jgi:hypothetical protein
LIRLKKSARSVADARVVNGPEPLWSRIGVWVGINSADHVHGILAAYGEPPAGMQAATISEGQCHEVA